MSEFRFHSISGEQIDRISPNFVYVCISTISRLGLLPVIAFCLFFTEVWPLIDVRILFVLNIYILLLDIFSVWPFLLHKRRSSLGYSQIL